MSPSQNPPDMPGYVPTRIVPHSSHWGAFSARVHDGIVEIVPHPRDPPRRRCSEIFPPRCRIGRGSRGR